jgi:hypothetical protein
MWVQQPFYVDGKFQSGKKNFFLQIFFDVHSDDRLSNWFFYACGRDWGKLDFYWFGKTTTDFSLKKNIIENRQSPMKPKNENLCQHETKE